MYAGIGRSLGTGYFRIADQLTGDEPRCLRRTRDLVDSEVLPVINGYRERAEFPWPLIQALIAGRDITGASRPRIAPRLPGRVKQATDLGRHHFTMNWRGRPLTSHQVIMQTSAATSTGTGLRVRAELDTGAYDTGSTSATPRWKPCR